MAHKFTYRVVVAAAAVAALGVFAIASVQLIGFIRGREDSHQQRIAHLVGIILDADRSNSEGRVRQVAAASELLDHGVSGVVTLFEECTGNEESFQAVRAVADVGEGALWALSACSEVDERRIRLLVVETLRYMLPHVQEAATELLDYLRDEDAEIRSEAVRALMVWAKGLERDDVPREVSRVLREDPDPWVRKTVAFWAREVRWRDVIRSVIDALEDEDLMVRRAASGALCELGADATDGAHALMEVIRRRSDDDVVRGNAMKALSRMGLEYFPSAPVLVELLGDGTPGVLVEASEMLERIGPECLPYLRKGLKHENADVRWGSARIVGTFEHDGAPAIPELVEGLHDKEPTIRAQCAEAIGQVGGDCKTSISAVVDILEDQEWAVRYTACDALGRFGAKAGSAGTALAKRLEDDNLLVRTRAAASLVEIGVAKKERVYSVLVEGLRSESGYVRRLSAGALGKAGKEARAALPALRRVAAEDEDEETKAAAEEAIRLIGTSVRD